MPSESASRARTAPPRRRRAPTTACRASPHRSRCRPARVDQQPPAAASPCQRGSRACSAHRQLEPRLVSARPRSQSPGARAVPRRKRRADRWAGWSSASVEIGQRAHPSPRAASRLARADRTTSGDGRVERLVVGASASRGGPAPRASGPCCVGSRRPGLRRAARSSAVERRRSRPAHRNRPGPPVPPLPWAGTWRRAPAARAPRRSGPASAAPDRGGEAPARSWAAPRPPAPATARRRRTRRPPRAARRRGPTPANLGIGERPRAASSRRCRRGHLAGVQSRSCPSIIRSSGRRERAASAASRAPAPWRS